MSVKEESFLQRWDTLCSSVKVNPSPRDWQMRFQVFGYTHALVERGLITKAQFAELQRDLVPDDASPIESALNDGAIPHDISSHMREVWNGLRLTLALVSNPRTLLFHIVGFSEVLFEDGIIQEDEYAAIQERAKSQWTTMAH